MKVYVVRKECRYPYEEFNDVELFETKEKAKKCFDKSLEQLKEDFNIDRYVASDMADYGETEDTAYFYNEQHDSRFELWIEEREVL